MLSLIVQLPFHKTFLDAAISNMYKKFLWTVLPFIKIWLIMSLCILAQTALICYLLHISKERFEHRKGEPE